MTDVPEHLISGPKAGINYPLTVQYCGNCSMPIEYCEYYPDYEKCKIWLEKNLPTEFSKVKLDDADGGATDDDKKRQKRGGKGIMKAKKSKDDGPKKVCVSRAPRGKKKSVTVVTGLSTFDIDLKVAAKYFGTKFACGSSVTGDDEIVIQGDVKDDLLEVIPEKWPEIDEIDDLGDQKR
ncbi:density-regulated protein homolog [Bradysia coprophila]|uniref:density-regulated protein homolog n=1 Tax=Bradysia coprophila TaxID=38358 RepID=UPI00187D7DB2|nr:density-regulated protein homolog [Bradysia coprophila]